MRRYLVFAFLLSLAPAVSAQGVVGSPYIAVHGTAKTTVVPDVFPLVVTLEQTSKDSAATQARIEALAKAVINVGKATDVADADMKVGNLSIVPSWDYDEATRKRVFAGNAYQRVVELRFHSLAMLKQALAKLPGGEQVSVKTGVFEFSKSDDTKKTLVAAAIGNARATAEQMAAGVGMRLVGVQSVSNERIDTGITYSTVYDDASAVAVSGSSADVVLKEGEIELSQDIYIVYLIAK